MSIVLWILQTLKHVTNLVCCVNYTWSSMAEKRALLSKPVNFSYSIEFLFLQIAYLRNLGCTVTPTSRLHASHLIGQYKSL